MVDLGNGLTSAFVSIEVVKQKITVSLLGNTADFDSTKQRKQEEFPLWKDLPEVQHV